MTRSPSRFTLFAKSSTVRKFLPDCEVETFYSEEQMLAFALRCGKRCKVEGLTLGVLLGVSMAISIQIGFDLWRNT